MYKLVSEDSLPDRKGGRPFRFESTPAWKRMKVDLDSGSIKGKTVLRCCLKDINGEKYDITNIVTIWRFVQRYVQAKHWPYTVKRRTINGTVYVIVKHK